MSHPLVVSDEAIDDLDDAYRWYEAQQTGRGDDFLIEFRAHAERVRRAPDAYGRVFRQFRAAPFPHSQFILYYLIEPDHVRVVAVQRARANPRRWQRRK